jgi:hypothetical protein
MTKQVDIPVESRLTIQIFETKTLPSLSPEEITSRLIGLSYQWRSQQQAIIKPHARGLEGKYLQEHLEFVDQAPRIPEANAKKMIVELMYLMVGTQAMAEYLHTHWRI